MRTRPGTRLGEETMILTKRSLVAALLGATALGLAPAQAADPIKIGLTGPYTGGSSSMGVSMRDGAKSTLR